MAVTWTTQRSGNWSLVSTDPSSPWYDGAAQTGYARTPGSSGNVNDDYITIANGHTLTCDASVTIGDSTTPATLAIATAGTGGTGVLNVSGGVTLTVVSNVKQGNTTWTFAAGSSLVLNSASNLSWQVADANSQANAKLVLSGTSGSHVTVTGTGGGLMRFTSGGTITQHDWSYVDISGFGNSSQPGIYYYISGGTAPVARWSYCTFTSCGAIAAQGAGHAGASIFEIDSCSWTSTPTSYCVAPNPYNVARTTGTRAITRSFLDKQLGNATSLLDFTVAGNCFDKLQISTGYRWSQFAGNLIRHTGTSNGSTSVNSVVEGGSSPETNTWNYVHIHNDGGSISNNPHPVSLSSNMGVTIGGWIFDPGNTDASGDLVVIPGPAAAQTYIIKYILALPIADGANLGKHCGTLSSALGGANATFSVTHCTQYSDSAASGENGAARVGETYAGHAGMVSAVKSNLAWSQNSGSAVAYCRLSLGTVSDICSAANCDYNGFWNPVASTQGVGTYPGVPGYYDYAAAPPAAALFSSTAGLGAHDVALVSNPFVDVDMSVNRWRHIGTWAVFKGQAADGDPYQTKVTAAYAYIKAGASSGDVGNRIADLVNWVKAGWSVTAATLRDAGHDGLTIGALEYTSTSSAVPIILMTSGRCI